MGWLVYLLAVGWMVCSSLVVSITWSTVTFTHIPRKQTQKDSWRNSASTYVLVEAMYTSNKLTFRMCIVTQSICLFRHSNFDKSLQCVAHVSSHVPTSNGCGGEEWIILCVVCFNSYLSIQSQANVCFIHSDIGFKNWKERREVRSQSCGLPFSSASGWGS